MNLALVGSPRCGDPARAAADGTIAPLNAARTAQRAAPTRSKGAVHEKLQGILFLLPHGRQVLACASLLAP